MSDMTKLANLLACLEIDLVELREVNNTELRLKVQKTVYLLNYLGEKGFDYPFSFYVRDPTLERSPWIIIELTPRGLV